MITLEVANGATKFINDDGDYCVSYDCIGEIFPLVLGPEVALTDIDPECPF